MRTITPYTQMAHTKIQYDQLSGKQWQWKHFKASRDKRHILYKRTKIKLNTDSQKTAECILKYWKEKKKKTNPES
jgi:hypothetical protein